MPTWYPTIVQKAISMPLLTLLEKRGEYIKHSSGYSSIVRGRTYFCERGTRNVQHIYFIDTRYLKVPGYTATSNHFRHLPKNYQGLSSEDFHVRNRWIFSKTYFNVLPFTFVTLILICRVCSLKVSLDIKKYSTWRIHVSITILRASKFKTNFQHLSIPNHKPASKRGK